MARKAFEIPEDFVFRYPWSESTLRGAFCICIVCGEKRQATERISEYPFRYLPLGWGIESRTRGIRCRSCLRHSAVGQPEFYAKYEVHVVTDGSLPRIQVRPRERLWVDGERKEAVVEEDEGEMVTDSAKHMKTRAKDHFGQVGGAVAMGLKLAAVNEGGEVLIDIAQEIAKDSPFMEAMLESDEGREIAKMLVALTVSGMCHYTDYVPKKEIVAELMAMQMTASGFTLAAPRMKMIRKHMERLAGVGEKLAEIGEPAGVQARVEDEEPAEEAEVESIEKVRKKKARA